MPGGAEEEPGAQEKPNTIEEKPGEKIGATTAKSQHIELENEPGAEKAQKESRMQSQMGNNWRRIRVVPTCGEGRQFREPLRRIQCA